MLQKQIPRVMIAGTSSGCGKTTAVCAVLSLLLRRSVKTAAFKCGPDYIDPMFHRAVTGVDCTNLDPYFCDRDTLCRLLAHRADGHALAVLEGVMGYYDGTGVTGTANSTYTVASGTDTPVILTVNAKGAAASLLAVIEGFLRFVPHSGITGVIFNNISAMTYAHLKALCAEHFGEELAVLGYLPRLDEACLLGSRHLGLITAAEITDLKDRLGAIADIAEKTLDLDAILALADTAPALSCTTPEMPALPPVRIAVAKDKAFCFAYSETLALFEKLGAEIVPFSPLANEPVPDVHGLYLPGGYPELYADRLESNTISRNSVRDAVAGGMPTIAECGGFLYLGKTLDGKAMCGALPHESAKTEKLVRFGYVTLTARRDGLLCAAGDTLRAHEFHYWDSDLCGKDFTAEKTNGRKYDCAVMTDTLYAGYPHLYLYANPQAAERFYRACLTYKNKKAEG